MKYLVRVLSRPMGPDGKIRPKIPASSGLNAGSAQIEGKERWQMAYLHQVLSYLGC